MFVQPAPVTSVPPSVPFPVPASVPGMPPMMEAVPPTGSVYTQRSTQLPGAPPSYYAPQAAAPSVQQHVISGYTPRQPPVFGKKGLDTQAQIAFTKEFIAYAQAQDKISISTGQDVGTVMMSACMTAEAKAHHARFTFNMAIEDITERQWELFFEASLGRAADNKAVVIAMIHNLSMDNSILDVADRMTDWQAKYHKILVTQNAEDIDYFHPKPVVQALIPGIKPDGVRALIKQDYDFDDPKLKQNIFMFWERVRERLSHVLPAMRAEANAQLVRNLRNKKKKMPDETPQIVVAEVKRLNELKAQTAAETKRLSDLKAKVARVNSASRTPPSGARTIKCWACGEAHHLNDCKNSTADAKKEIIAQKRKENEQRRKAQTKKLSRAEHELPQGALPGHVNGSTDGPPVPVLLDTGSDIAAIISRGLAELLVQQGVAAAIETAPAAQPLEGFGQVPMVLSRYMVLKELVLDAQPGPLTLLNISAWVDETDAGSNITLGRAVMQTLGYDLDVLLHKAHARRAVWDMTESATLALSSASMVKRAVLKWRAAGEDELDQLVDDNDEHDVPVPDGKDVTTAVKDILTAAVQEANQNGLPEPLTRELYGLVMRAIDVFRIKPTKDPPIAVEPLVVTLKDGYVAFKCAQRRYNPRYTQFLGDTITDLLDHGLAYMNPNSHWASAPRIVPKKSGELRMTVDLRGVNAQTVPLVWPMPMLNVVMARLSGTTCYFVADWFRGFWQLGLHPDCQEWFSILGIDCVITSNRVQMGQTDAVAYCQRVAQEVYGEKYGDGLEGWVDDVLGSAKSPRELINLLEFLLGRCVAYGLKLHPGKCTFFRSRSRLVRPSH